MSDGKWTEATALAFLKEQGVLPIDKTFESPQTGLKGWGAIDFLCHYCGYQRVKRVREGRSHE